VAITERVIALGEEFSEYILVDVERDSIIINIEDKYFDILCLEYKRLNYKLIHSSTFKSKDSMTCVFTKCG
jgi:hypothetical protein